MADKKKFQDLLSREFSLSSDEMEMVMMMNDDGGGDDGDDDGGGDGDDDDGGDEPMHSCFSLLTLRRYLWGANMFIEIDGWMDRWMDG